MWPEFKHFLTIVILCCRHQELVSKGGMYAVMWQQQLENDKTPESTLPGTSKDIPARNINV